MSAERRQYRIDFEGVAAHAKEITIQDGHHSPILIVEGSKSLAVSQIQEMPETHDERIRLMLAFGQAAAASGKIGRLKQVFFVSEGWMSVAAKDRPPQTKPSQDPQRKEVLIVSGLALERPHMWLRIFEMVRDRDEQVTDLLEITPRDGRQGKIKIPLLEAFAQGFRRALQAMTN